MNQVDQSLLQALHDEQWEDVAAEVSAAGLKRATRRRTVRKALQPPSESMRSSRDDNCRPTIFGCALIAILFIISGRLAAGSSGSNSALVLLVCSANNQLFAYNPHLQGSLPLLFIHSRPLLAHSQLVSWSCGSWLVLHSLLHLARSNILTSCAAIYTVYTSPTHPPIPNHLPTLIVTPHGMCTCSCQCIIRESALLIIVSRPTRKHTVFVPPYQLCTRVLPPSTATS